MRDVIVLSSWGWEYYGTPERVCLALASLGARVLHCTPPVSFFRAQPIPPLQELQKNVYGLRLSFLSSRAMDVPILRDLQATAMRRQITRAALRLNLREPLWIYSWISNLFSIAAQMSQSHYSIHLCNDDIGMDPHYGRYVDASDLTLVVPKTCFHRLKAKFGEKVKLIPQPVEIPAFTGLISGDTTDPMELARIPRPRLGYLGKARRRLNQSLLTSLLQAHPEWQFISVGGEKAVSLPNAHTLPWVSPEISGRYVAGLDIGFMPYDCYQEFNLHCVPLKLFEYFALGLPVVSTPIIHLWEYRDLVYFGDTAEELASAVVAALNEPADSPKRAARIEIARRHSLENLATVLRQCLPLEPTEVV